MIARFHLLYDASAFRQTFRPAWSVFRVQKRGRQAFRKFADQLKHIFHIQRRLIPVDLTVSDTDTSGKLFKKLPADLSVDFQPHDIQTAAFFQQSADPITEIGFLILKFIVVELDIRVSGRADCTAFIYIIAPEQLRREMRENRLNPNITSLFGIPFGRNQICRQRLRNRNESQRRLPSAVLQQRCNVQGFVHKMRNRMMGTHDLRRNHGIDELLEICLYPRLLLFGQVLIGQVPNRILLQLFLYRPPNLLLSADKPGNSLVNFLQLFPRRHSALVINFVR